MTRQRYEELRAAGPEIKAEEYDRLGRFVPKLTLIALSVRVAYWRGRSRRFG